MCWVASSTLKRSPWRSTSFRVPGASRSNFSVEKDPLHYSFIRSFVDKLHDQAAEPLRADVFRFLERCREQFDFIFADPPYMLKELEQLPDIVLSHDLLRPEGLFVLEHGKTQDFSAHPRFVEHRAYGSVNFSFFQ